MSSDHHIGVVLDRVAADLWFVYNQLTPGALTRVGPLLRDIYYDLDALSTALLICLAVATLCHTISTLTRNQSVVDKLWSILPVGYTWHFLWRSHLRDLQGQLVVDPRLVLIALLVTVWGSRLTFNFWRKGGYALHAEDYRWEVVRQGGSGVPVSILPVFNLFFVSFYQNILLLLITLPVYAAWRHAGTPLNRIDALAFLLCSGFLALETAADHQMWNFQVAKHAKAAAGKRLTGDYGRGFLTSGLFAYSRHPNFFAEQAFWASIYLFGVAASGSWIHWSGLGVLQLIALFHFSTSLTEDITARKYSKYKAYQASTSRLVPWVPGKPKWR
ncbi:Uncharacterized protein F751_2738 [Auxenochlorella protothecoides]|uniref:Steroid 5-alpha reductase C-terminal domain-containing protein n=1 Tax=Auxenochlorella protothecoides TaxID=3075 RepID=A0A087SPU3_AUXPR|nr:Uncharacterized protein F751_2738 [Auxenochlorella protothecoides]KFM27747.1 Uncharacterized protein F751_2738 [Auxenochlorella protothecoides]